MLCFLNLLKRKYSFHEWRLLVGASFFILFFNSHAWIKRLYGSFLKKESQCHQTKNQLLKMTALGVKTLHD